MSMMLPTHQQWDALAAVEGIPPTASNIAKFGKQFDPESVRWAFEQWTLRERAKAKFALAHEMLFTRTGLEMSTHERTAAFHASLFGDSPVADLTCGIGADLIALAKRGPTKGFDLDPIHVAYAQHNLKVHGLEAEVSVADASTYEGTHCLMIDPARRSGRVRTLDPDQFSPTLTSAFEIASRAPSAVIKLSPMLPDELLEQPNSKLIFVSHKGECCEALIVFGQEGRGAVHVESGEFLESEPVDQTVDEPENYIYAADPAAIRAGCLGSFEAESLGDSNGYLTSPDLIQSPWLAPFELTWSGKWHEKQIQEVIRTEGLKLEAVKTRGVQIDPAKVMKTLKPGGSEQAVLLLYCIGKSIRAIVAKRISNLP